MRDAAAIASRKPELFPRRMISSISGGRLCKTTWSWSVACCPQERPIESILCGWTYVCGCEVSFVESQLLIEVELFGQGSVTSAESTSTPGIISTCTCRLLISYTNLRKNMSLTCQNVARSCIRSLRSSSNVRISAVTLSQRRKASPARRWASTDAATNPKVAGIVDQISQLTLLETADLVSSLKASNFWLIANISTVWKMLTR